MLRIERVSKTYPNGKAALADVSLTVEAAEIVALIGGSGCGKSTLLRIVAGLDHLTSGDVEVGGERIEGPHPSVGLVFQEPRLLPWLDVGANILFGISDQPAHERRHRLTGLLQSTGLAEYEFRWPRELSGGQAQRVSIARALAARPHVLLLDEPFSALDPFTRAELHEVVLSLWTQARTTIVLVTHDIDEALALADRIVVMRADPGRIATIVDVDQPRPRNRLSRDFEAAKAELLRALNATFAHRVSNAATSLLSPTA